MKTVEIDHLLVYIGKKKTCGSITLIKGRHNILVDTGSPWEKDLLLQGTVNLLYLVCMIFDAEISFWPSWHGFELAYSLMCMTIIFIHICMAFGDILDLMEAAFHQNCLIEYTTKCNVCFTVNDFYKTMYFV